MNKIKICHITRDINPFYHYFFGGVPNWIKYICEITSSYYKNIYICPETNDKTPNKFANVYFIKKYNNFFLNRIYSFIHIFRILKKERPKLIHLYLLSTLNEIEIYLLKKLLKIKIVATCFNDISTSTLLNFQYRILKTTFLDKIIVINRNLKRILIKYNIPKDKLVIIPVIPNKNFYEVENNSNIINNKSQKKIQILFSAGLRKEMGLYYIIKEFITLSKISKNLKFIISYVNNDTNEKIIQKIKSILNKYNVSDSFIFKGFIYDMKSFLKQIDILVIPILKYKSKMNTPKMALEALLMGKLIISTPYGGMPELISNYENGILIEPIENNFVNEIIKIINENKELINKCGINGRKKILDKFHPKLINLKILEFYNKLLNTK
ncbi:MAG: glycosyltransferase [Candidatus Helarchaeota archaeon]